MSNKKSLKFDKSAFIAYKNTPITKEYTLGKTLGSGAFGTVRSAIHKATKQPRAIKILKKSEQDEEKLFLEVNILSKLSHPNIMHIYEFYDDNSNFYIVSELCPGGELFDMITEKGCFSESEASPIMKQLMSAITYCHQNHIVHRDLKPENILLEDHKGTNEITIKLIDWGGARYFSKNKKMTKINGTPYYIAPEVLNEVYDEKCDIWSAGVILYILLCGYPPFNGNDDDEIFESIKKRKFVFPEAEWANISKEAKDLINKMLSDPLTRLTAEQVLVHPWLVNQLNKNTKAKEIKLNFNTFKTYSGANKLSRAVLTYIASRLTDDEVKKLKDAFQKIDVNGDGMLTLEELKNAINQNPEVHVMNIEQIFKTIDTDNSGVINYTEFLAASIDKRIYLQEDKLRDAFKLFDEDKSGKISKSEISKVLKFKKSGTEMTKLFEKYDLNGDGEIDFEEFLNMMKDL